MSALPELARVPGAFAVCRLGAGEPVPPWATTGSFFSVSGAADELSIVCEQALVPGDVRCERGWACFRVKGTLDFALIGILAGVAGTLARAGVSLFAVSTFDTDYFLVKESSAALAESALRGAGYRF